ncbi:MAG TPA: class I SAM-dependent methyltransferase, partial [Thermomicrobiales bacterium]|nr:class I SAM-dependent methyltransferase [Thermomicrobiales bacterium]
MSRVDGAGCALCGGERFRTLFVARDRLLGRPGEFPVARCHACGLTQLRPPPSADTLAAHYPDTYYPLDAEPAAEAIDVARGLLERVADWTTRSGRTAPRVLDVGCGTGLYLHLARQQGMSARGVELSESAAAYGRERFGLDIHHGTLETAALSPGSFDVITMWHVLEHLPDPVGALRRCASALAPGGSLLIGTPNFASFEARVFGRRWYSLDAPRHLYHFTPWTLAAALQRADMQVEQIVHSTGTAGLVYSIMGDLTGVSLKLRSRPLNES